MLRADILTHAIEDRLEDRFLLFFLRSRRPLPWRPDRDEARADGGVFEQEGAHVALGHIAREDGVQERAVRPEDAACFERGAHLSRRVDDLKEKPSAVAHGRVDYLACLARGLRR